MSDAPWPDYLFDIGNVILFFDYQRFTRRIEAECACPVAELLPSLAKEMQLLEGRSLPVDEFLERAFARIRYRGRREAFVCAWQEIFEPNQPVVDLIQGLGDQGHRLYLLSNTNQLHADYFLRQYPVFERFHGCVFSHEVGCAKPEPEIYQTAIRKLGLQPARTVYVDDLPANVEAGAAHGFIAVRYAGQPVAELTPQAMRVASGNLQGPHGRKARD